MILAFGILEGKNSFKPLLFDAHLLRDEDKTKKIIRFVDRENKDIRLVSSVFEMPDKEVSNLMNHYGISDIYKIVGARKCEEVWYEADV